MNSDKYILIVNGPNINLTGIRRTDIYGSGSYSDMTAWIEANAPCRIVVEQYNAEGQIIDALHRAHFDNECAGIVLNAGAYTHYSYAIADAVEAITKPVVEVHISNILSPRGLPLQIGNRQALHRHHSRFRLAKLHSRSKGSDRASE